MYIKQGVDKISASQGKNPLAQQENRLAPGLQADIHFFAN